MLGYRIDLLVENTVIVELKPLKNWLLSMSPDSFLPQAVWLPGRSAINFNVRQLTERIDRFGIGIDPWWI